MERKKEKKKAQPAKAPAKKAKKKKTSSLLSKRKSGDKELLKLKKQMEELSKSYRYLQAEFANYKRISLKEKEKALHYGAFHLVQDLLLNAVNDLNNALEKSWDEKDFKNFKQGMIIIRGQLMKTLKAHDVEEINPKEKLFDPHFHEVLSVKAEPNLPDQTVVEVLRRGYKMRERLIQPAGVIISSKEEKSET